MHLRLDADVQKLEAGKLRKGKKKAEEDLDSLKMDYKKLCLSMRTAGLGKTSEQWRQEIQEEKGKGDRDMMAQLTQLLAGGVNKGKGPMADPGEANQPRKVVASQQGSTRKESGVRQENPLPNHINKGVNMMSENMGEGVKIDIAEVKTPLKWVWKEMERRGLVISGFEKGWETKNYCEFHYETGHEIQRCEEFRALIQSMMDNKEMEFYDKNRGKKKYMRVRLNDEDPENKSYCGHHLAP
ncbi:hypothetical protein Gotri_006011 [Gossypium trilobum]|uniref:Uncharacterized protein n=1 Tax=Gossypium trilobum TaxID=34281 RepID=A0A7J9EYG4_9ROSI|nr:hypothetical protein [Gossypium trilobum]